MENKFKEINKLEVFKVFQFEDFRGSFTKIFSKGTFQNDLTDIAESYYSISSKDVIRGMHFQLPPFENYKLIHVIKGSIEDVVLDLRKESSTYLDFYKIELNEKNNLAILIPPGVAHGFKVLEDDTTMIYFSSKVFSSAHDCGIHYNSLNYDWRIEKPIVSDKDENLVTLSEFLKENPF
jgi:dTDP-4-dehydrorhamnose 3,5-epimerase/CDP-3, 6-dideoxy-D-glycero-D-glycero-4-hexulose-5-epimerase